MRKELENLTQRYRTTMRTIEERDRTITALQRNLQEHERDSQAEIAILKQEKQEILGSSNERRNKLNNLQRDFEEYKTGSDVELARLMQTVEDLRKQLDGSRKDSELQKMTHNETSQAHADEVRSLREILRKQRSELDTIHDRHKSELEGLKSKHACEVRDRERELRLQLEKRIRDLTAMVSGLDVECTKGLQTISGQVTRLETRYESIAARARRYNQELAALRTSAHEKDSLIDQLNLRLDDATKLEIQMRNIIKEMTTEGEERERELRDAKNCNDFLRNQLKVNHQLKNSSRSQTLKASMEEKLDAQNLEADQKRLEAITSERQAKDLGVERLLSQLQFRDQQLADLRKDRDSEAGKLKAIICRQEKSLMDSEQQKRDLSASLVRLEAEIESLNDALGSERRSRAEAVT